MSLVPVRITHADTAWHEAFLRSVPRVFPGLDFRPWCRRGGWTPAYEAHGLLGGDALVAGISVMRMRVVLDGRELRGAQLGAVGTIPEARGRGLQRPLMERVRSGLEDSTDLVFLHANERVLDFHPRFGFRRVEETTFELPVAIEPTADPAPRLELDSPAQVTAWMTACARSVPPTERFGVRDYGSIALWHASTFYPREVRVLREGECHAVAVRRGDTLILLDLAAPRRFDLLPLVPRLLGAPVSRVRFGFCPEAWCPSARAVGPWDDALFVRGDVALPAAPFKLPAHAKT